ncbi:MAG TPA: FIST N-terminal domain-containing protein [Candidatus Methanoperedens sp.]
MLEPVSTRHGDKLKSVTIFSNKKDHKQAAADIIEQARRQLDFKPDLALFYATLKYNGKYQSMLEIFHEEFGDIPQIGASVDGMIYPDDMHTDGAALVLCRDEKARIRVNGTREKGAIESAEKLAKQIKCEKGVVVLHFPLVYVPDILKCTESLAKGLYYSKRCNGADKKKQKEYAGKLSDYYNKENFLYLPPTVLNIFAEHTGYKVPIIGINVTHTQVRFNSPHIFCNFEDIDAGIAALTIEKDGVNAIYEDIFPDKGKTLEETKHIVRNEFKVIKEFKANFEKNVLVSLDGMPPVKAVKNLIYVSEKKKEDLLEHLDSGDLELYRPYELLFYNKKTKGTFLLGMGSYFPFDLFPFFMDVSDYSEDVALVYELIDDKFDNFISCLNKLKSNNGSFIYFFIDVGVTTAFGKKVFEYKDRIRNRLDKNYFGIISTTPSAYIPPEFQLRNYLSESLNNTFFMSAGTNACMEI